MQEQRPLSLRDILSEAETVSQEEIDGVLDSEIEEGEELLCDLPIELVQILCLAHRYFDKSVKVARDHYEDHERGEASSDRCGEVRSLAVQIERKALTIREIFFLLARDCGDIYQGNIGVRKGGVLVGIPEEEKDGLFIEAAEIGDVPIRSFLKALFGEESE